MAGMGGQAEVRFRVNYPLLANQTSEVLDPLEYWWGLTWSPLLDLNNLNQEQEQKLYVDFQKAQYSLLHVLSENFGTHEKQIIADHDPVRSSCRYLRFRAPLGTRHINRCALIGKPVCGGVCVGGGAHSTTPTYTVRSGGPAREPSWSAFWLQKPSILRAGVREDAGMGTTVFYKVRDRTFN